MSKPFDATLKDMLEISPVGWAEALDYSVKSVEVVDADVSTVTGASDKTLRARGEIEWILDINFQRGPDASVPRRTHLYSTVLENRHRLPVRSVVVLLTKQAQLAVINGVYQRGFPGEEPYDVFRYRVVKVWELPPEKLLSGGPGLLPLVPISAVTEEQLPGIIQQMKARLDPATVPKAKELWTATYVLMGLRYEREVIDRLLQGVIEMEESVTYQGIIEKGEAKEARKMLLLLGESHFGRAPAEVRTALEGIHDLDRLEQLVLRVDKVGSWQELLGLPSA